MRKEGRSSDKFKVNKLIIIFTFFLFAVLIVRLCYLCLVDYKVGDSTTRFIKNRNTTEEVIAKKRYHI